MRLHPLLRGLSLGLPLLLFLGCGGTAPDLPPLPGDPLRECMMTTLPRLTVTGNRLQARCGDGLVDVRLKGINRSGLQHKNGLALAGFGADPTVELKRWRDEWLVSVIRLPFAQSYYTTYAEAPQYRAGIATIISAARSLGMYVMLELHGYDENNLGIAQPDPSSTPALWADLAKTYGGESHVLFDIWNEPHSVPWSTWKANAEKIISAIRGAGATETLVVVGGLDWAYDLSPLADPQNRLTGLGPIIYATHPYPLKKTPPTTAADWDEKFGRVADQVPVLVGEFGADDTQSVPVGLGSKAAARDWLTALLNYVDGKRLSALAWSGGDLPHLCLGQDGGPVVLPQNPPDPGRPTDPFGQVVQSWLKKPL